MPVLDIIELRAYARAKDTLKHAKRPEDIPNDPMIDIVFEVETEIARGRKEGILCP